MGRMTFDWDISSTLQTEVDGQGFTQTQVAVEGGADAQDGAIETHHMYGFYGRAFGTALDDNGNYDPTQASQTLYALDGGEGHALALEHPAVVQLLPTIEPGETMFYGPAGQFERTTLDGHFLKWAPAGGDGEHEAAQMFGADGWGVSGRWGSLKVDDSGFHYTNADGSARLDIGAIGLPGLSSIASYINMTAGSIGANASNVMLGAKNTGATAPLVNGMFVMAELLAIKAALAALSAAIAAGTVSALGPGQFPTAAVVAAACEAVLAPTPINLYLNAQGTV